MSNPKSLPQVRAMLQPGRVARGAAGLRGVAQGGAGDRHYRNYNYNYNYNYNRNRNRNRNRKSAGSSHECRFETALTRQTVTCT